MTQQPQSTISYNTVEFLTDKLQYLIEHDYIRFYAFICHKGEYDEILNKIDKDHIHLYIVPNQRLDLNWLEKCFDEYNDSDLLPLGVTYWKHSLFSEWYLYVLHDKDYLASKFLEREYHYTMKDFHTSKESAFVNMVQDAMYSDSSYTRNKNLVSFLENGGTLNKIIRSGSISPNQATGYYYFNELLKKENKCKKLP